MGRHEGIKYGTLVFNLRQEKINQFNYDVNTGVYLQKRKEKCCYVIESSLENEKGNADGTFWLHLMRKIKQT